jgi:thiamine-phosphate pyrophosphorylase
MSAIDYSLYLVTDAQLAGGRSLRQIVAAAIYGGVTMVQYREKNASTRRMIEEALELCQLCCSYNVPFIVNDRLDVALAVGADGVHLGQDDMPAAVARKLIGPGKILGVSVENAAQAQAALADGADYVGASPIFATPTKADAPPPMGIAGLQELARGCTLPIVAIGGLNAANAAAVLRAGAAGLAVVSAIVSAEDTERAARELKEIITDTRRSLQQS